MMLYGIETSSASLALVQTTRPASASPKLMKHQAGEKRKKDRKKGKRQGEREREITKKT